jgi:hypothetical protein
LGLGIQAQGGGEHQAFGWLKGGDAVHTSRLLALVILSHAACGQALG